MIWRLRTSGKTKNSPFRHQGSENTAENEFYYTATVPMPEKEGLVWYYFIVETGGKAVYYINNNDSLGGVGQTQTEPANNSYQITVYDKDYKTPDWFKGQIMYQIFTDRFSETTVTQMELYPKKRNEYIIHSDWYEPISFNAHPFEMGPACNDFYGGNLSGIIDKLKILKKVWVLALYI